MLICVYTSGLDHGSHNRTVTQRKRKRPGSISGREGPTSWAEKGRAVGKERDRSPGSFFPMKSVQFSSIYSIFGWPKMQPRRETCAGSPDRP